jgi:ATP-binding protein involved in chromosome partitioning
MNVIRPDDVDIEQRVLAALRTVTVGPDGPDVVDGGLIHAVVATDGVVRVLFEPERLAGDDGGGLAAAIMPLVRAVPGVTRAVVKARPRPPAGRRPVPGIRHVVAVHSGKGGVGKSTVAANMAAALARDGARTGLLDIDVYGPSGHVLFGLAGRAETAADGRRIAPKEAFGVTVMSPGFLVPEGQALLWRGSLVDAGIPQLFFDVAWGALDYLVVDMPPGTSDVHLATLARVALSGVVTVTAPGQVSVEDVRRGMEMFADLAVPCLGLVENMAGVVCPGCGHTQPLFGAGGADELAVGTGLPVLARLPFVPALAAAAEKGKPAVIAEPDGPSARTFTDLARRLRSRLPVSVEETL